MPSMIDLPRKLSYVRLSDLAPALRNSKNHDHVALAASMRRFGFVNPPLIDERTGRLIAGHGRQETLVEMRARGESPPVGIILDDDGEWMLPVVRGWASTSDEEAEALNLADNLTNEAGGWYRNMLAEQMESIATFDATLLDTMGWTGDQMHDLLAEVNIDQLAGDLGPEPVILPDALDPKDGEQTIDVPPAIGEENPDRPLDGDDDEGTSADLPKTTCPACSHSWVRPEDNLTVLGSSEPVSLAEALAHAGPVIASLR